MKTKTKKPHKRAVKGEPAFAFDATKVLAWLRAGVDGHGLYSPEKYTEMGFPAAFVALHEREYKSDGTAKGTIFVEGKAVKGVTAVYELEFLGAVVAKLGLGQKGNNGFIGRGFRAREYGRVLVAHLDPPTEAAPKPTVE